MKKNTYIFFIIIFYSFFKIFTILAYTLQSQSFNNLIENYTNNFYTLDKAVISESINDTAQNSAYSINSGYLSYLESNLDPAYFYLIGKKGRITYQNLFAPDSIQIAVYDYDSDPVKDVEINYSIINKPTGSSGETIYYSATNDSGISYASFKTGNKTGAYIVKSEYSDYFRDFIGFHTDEMVIPANEWRMIGVNKIPANPDVKNTFDGIVPDYIYHWDPAAEEDEFYQKFDEVKTISAGKGYFIIVPNESTLKLQGAYKDDTAAIQLKTGWNLLASPYYYNTSWTASKIITTSGNIISVNDAQTQGYIENKIYWYKDNTYLWGPNSSIPEPSLYTWTGFWLYANKDCELQLSPYFYYSENSAINLAPKKSYSTDNWEMLVSVKGDKSSDLINYFGVNKSATSNYDSFDVKKAPMFGDIVSAGFNNGQYLARDIRKGPIETVEVWSLDVHSGNNSHLTINAGAIDAVDNGLDMYLIDGPAYYNLREQPEFLFDSIKNKKYSYLIAAGKPEYVKALLTPPLAKEETYVKPNPGPDAAGNIAFCYSVPDNGSLKLKIYDLAGIKVLEKSLDVSQTQFNWDCRNERGKSIRTGVYLYLLEYSGITGSFKMTDKFALLR